MRHYSKKTGSEILNPGSIYTVRFENCDPGKIKKEKVYKVDLTVERNPEHGSTQYLLIIYGFEEVPKRILEYMEKIKKYWETPPNKLFE